MKQRALPTRVVVSVLGVALIAGMPACAPSDEPVAVNTRYDSVYDIRKAMEDAGYACTTWDVVREPDSEIQFASCTPEIILATFSGSSSPDEFVGVLEALFVDRGGEKIVNVVGPNWMVSCTTSETLCSHLHQTLGGTLDVREP